MPCSTWTQLACGKVRRPVMYMYARDNSFPSDVEHVNRLPCFNATALLTVSPWHGSKHLVAMNQGFEAANQNSPVTKNWLIHCDMFMANMNTNRIHSLQCLKVRKRCKDARKKRGNGVAGYVSVLTYHTGK